MLNKKLVKLLFVLASGLLFLSGGCCGVRQVIANNPPLQQSGEVTVVVEVESSNPFPDPFALYNPANQSQICNFRPVFNWQIPNSLTSIDYYRFRLWTNEGTIIFEQSVYDQNSQIVQVGDQSYKSWIRNGQFYLQIQQDFSRNANLIYYWQVEAFNTAGSSRYSDTFNFAYRADCFEKECTALNLPEVNISQPSSSPVLTNRPAIVFGFNYTQMNDIAFQIKIDNQDWVNLGAVSQTTDKYRSYYDASNHQITLNPLVDLWSSESTAEHKIEVIAQTPNGCQKSQNVTFTYNAGGADEEKQCQSTSAAPILIAPENNVVFTAKTAIFKWKVCRPLICTPDQNFILNQVPLFNFPAASVQTANYNLAVSTALDSSCGNPNYHAVYFTLQLNKTSYNIGGQTVGVFYNDVANLEDWNYWRVSSGGAAAAARFRVLDQAGAIYHWCSTEGQCVTGTPSECLASGRACYTGEKASAACLAAAPQDCSGVSPAKLYHWCTGSEACTSGSFAQCYLSGRPCYAQTGAAQTCLTNAARDCSLPVDGTCSWCFPTADNCMTGSCQECYSLGRNCFSSLATAQDCQQNSDIACAAGEILTLSALARDTLLNNESLNKVLNNLGIENVAELIAVTTEKAAAGIAGFATQVFPSLSVAIFLPFGILLVIYIHFRGQVFRSDTGKGLPQALIVLETEVLNPEYSDVAEFVAVDSRLTDKDGNYLAFLINQKGNYRFKVEIFDYHFPSLIKKRPFWQTKLNYYQGESFKGRQGQRVFAFVPLDPKVTDVGRRHFGFYTRLMLSARQIWRHLAPWGGVFAGLTFIFTLVYPTWLNILVASFYLIALLERVVSVLIWQNNLNLLMVDELGVPLNGFPVKIVQRNTNEQPIDPRKRLIEIKATDEHGYLRAKLDKGDYSFSFLTPYARLVNKDQNYSSFNLRILPNRIYKNVLLIKNILNTPITT